MSIRLPTEPTRRIAWLQGLADAGVQPTGDPRLNVVIECSTPEVAPSKFLFRRELYQLRQMQLPRAPLVVHELGGGSKATARGGA